MGRDGDWNCGIWTMKLKRWRYQQSWYWRLEQETFDYGERQFQRRESNRLFILHERETRRAKVGGAKGVFKWQKPHANNVQESKGIVSLGWVHGWGAYCLLLFLPRTGHGFWTRELCGTGWLAAHAIRRGKTQTHTQTRNRSDQTGRLRYGRALGGCRIPEGCRGWWPAERPKPKRTHRNEQAVHAHQPPGKQIIRL